MTQELQESEEESDYEDVFELEKEFLDLRKEKRKQLQSRKQKQSESKDQDLAIVGSVEDIEKKDAGRHPQVTVTVEYVLDGEIRKESFNLEKPESEEEFSTDNKFVRMVNFFGDKNGKPTGLMHRDVWLKVREEESVELHIPRSLSKSEIALQKLRRKKVESGLAGWDESISSVTTRNSIIGSVSALGAVMGFLGMFSALGAEFAVLNMSASVIGLLFVLLIAGAGSVMLSDSEEDLLKPVKVLSIGAFIICTLALLGFTGMDVPPQEAQGFTTTLSNMVVGTSIWMLIILSITYLLTPFRAIFDTVADLKNRVKNWYNEKRGIEYVD